MTRRREQIEDELLQASRGRMHIISKALEEAQAEAGWRKSLSLEDVKRRIAGMVKGLE